jgi:hypothetical protein
LERAKGEVTAIVGSFDNDKVKTAKAGVQCLLWIFHKLKLRDREMKKNNCYVEFVKKTKTFFDIFYPNFRGSEWTQTLNLEM